MHVDKDLWEPGKDKESDLDQVNAEKEYHEIKHVESAVAGARR